MGLIEQQNLLAKIYTDEDFRRIFLAEPEKTGKEFGLKPPEIADLKKILPDEIIAFSESLFYKRLREVERLLVLTQRTLQDEFEKQFHVFAGLHNPRSIKKHLEDALEFTRFLQTLDSLPSAACDIIKFERARLEFTGLGKRFVFRRFAHDIRTVSAEGMPILLAKRMTWAVWVRVLNVKRLFIF